MRFLLFSAAALALALTVSARAAERPVFWLDATRLVTIDGAAIFLRRLDTFAERRRLVSVDAYGANAIWSACFAPRRWVVGLSRREKIGSSVSEKTLKKTLFISLKGGEIDATEVRAVANPSVNAFDCADDLDYNQKKRAFEKFAPAARQPSINAGALATSRDAATSAEFHWYDIPSKRYRSIAFAAIGDETKRLRFDFEPGYRHTGLRASYDAATKRYLWTSPTRDFFSKASWPRKAWLLSDRLKILETLDLPAGPWVRPAGVWKSLSCFSCGCDCYTRMRTHLRKGRILIEIRGRTAWRGTRGVYLLNAERTGWRAIVRAPITRPVTISEDGCRVAYVDDRLRVRDHCAKRDWRS